MQRYLKKKSLKKKMFHITCKPRETVQDQLVIVFLEQTNNCLYLLCHKLKGVSDEPNQQNCLENKIFIG